MSPSPLDRLRRVSSLTGVYPHSAVMLRFYAEVLKGQQTIYESVRQGEWLARVRRPEGEVPRLRLSALPMIEFVPGFARFTERLLSSAPDVLRSVGERLLAEPRLHLELLNDLINARPPDRAADRLGCAAVPVGFFPRAFLQPIAGALAALNHGDQTPDGGTGCPQCGWPPQVSCIRDEPDAKGVRMLVCSLCTGTWRFPRSTCPKCRETETAQLEYHTAENTPHLRIESCATCSSYIKSVDLRTDGRADPIVDDLASVELDLWCQEQQLDKIQPSLLGL